MSAQGMKLLSIPFEEWEAKCNGQEAYSDMAPAMLSVAVVREDRLHKRIAALELAVLNDTARLDRLSRTHGFVQGIADGEPSYRIMASENWHPTLREAIDEVAVKTTKKNLKPNEE